MHGWIILDKPLGLGSTQAVAAVKRNLRSAGFGKVKVGHGGTLDPLATGVLPIALGEATKLCGRMLDASKTYDFTICFGTETSGLDAGGEVVATSDVRPTLEQVQQALAQFTGPIEQIPPAYSAIKIDGKRAYDLARAGEVVEMKSRAVTVYQLTICHAELVSASYFDRDESKTLKQVQDDALLSSITLTADVSKGTYIRSLARDIAYALGTVGHVSMLRRVRAGPFALNGAISLDKLNAFGQGAAQEDIILPIEAGLVDIPALDLSPEQARAIQQGRVLTGIAMKDGLHWARDADLRPIALVENIDGALKTVRGFNLTL
ncbi:MAG: tRNA pseudouridine(55) synthase TruB [Sphingomonadales bacterium 35-56-22]|jgi:tRNA pseudouridine55 synthase|uniref:tRNA pseudouridine(55) synthase TruB n=1 Tax=Sphingorhabdus sp. TaxID=1902408 RepID=UPI000BCAB0A1|nr:tRNA pseudouridine(55) synthase TruB [Sphingorhabdus sp.]OYY16452.1 MAG: tRNA pseudouridine(55) synthase TruB [Sphingomonadales bacterium 35-56-22]OYY98219.1 MAG: tRNA pseudouridine(55) synthase TruB [Sphingomonadales bacterium 28-56-43]OYZ60690.1 MAG: tRNA pseudouridine(55) synthase TruB [Sphingomonadales bacterium 24-56-14]OZA83761.1 MAG: tRNA pseudouridine(55) synthase TruB [Sphingomonadales bacterium 39-57-19]HQS11863.1 tRNA pseudouridine(55) synthase TruB [Sphingorhabdus sp.]